MARKTATEVTFEIIQESLKEIRNDFTQLKGELNDIREEVQENTIKIDQQTANAEHIDKCLARLEDQIVAAENRYVHKETFEPVRLVVYGAVTLILIGFMTALIALVI